MEEALTRKSQLAWGACLICVVFLLETVNADRLLPNPLSPLVWTVLGIGGVVSAALALWFRRRAAQARSQRQAPTP